MSAGDGSVVALEDNRQGRCEVPALPPGLAYVEVSARKHLSVARATGALNSVVRSEPVSPCGSVSSYCWPAAANSVSPTGTGFSLDGCPGLTVNDLVFTVAGLPPGKLGVFFYGAQQQYLPFGNGWACVSGGTQRVLPPLAADPEGMMTYPVDLTQFPFSGSPHPILAGSPWNFQFSYRDPAGAPSSFNLSDARHIVLAP